MLVEVRPNPINESFHLLIFITYLFRNNILMDSPTHAVVLRTDPVTVGVVWAGFGVVASAVPTMSRVSAIEQRTQVTWRVWSAGVSSLPSVCDNTWSLKRFSSTDIWKPLEAIPEN